MINYIKKLADILNISSSFHDEVGKKHILSNNDLLSFINAFGFKIKNQNDAKNKITELKNEKIRRFISPVYSFFEEENFFCEIYLPFGFDFEIIIKNQNGIAFSKKYTINKSNIIKTVFINEKKYIKTRILINKKFNPDYYDFILKVDDKFYQSLFIIAPIKAYTPKFIKDKKKISGIATQLYALSSKNSQGIGDFSSLSDIIKFASKNGLDIVGVNPLGAMGSDGKEFSPYRLLNRKYINYIYLDLTKIIDYKKSPEVQKYISSKNYESILKQVQNSKYVDYKNVFKLKMTILEKMYDYFKKEDLKKNTPRAKSYLKFIKEEGVDLENLCFFESVYEKSKKDFKSFPSEKLKLKHRKRILFYAYLHWLSHIEILKLKNLCQKLKMKIGLYIDIPVGASSIGEEVFSHPNIFATSMSIGAPPDSIRRKGQNWGLTPPIPHHMKLTNYSNFISEVKANMKYAGAIRIDHAFLLQRLFWINKKGIGTYINYDLKEMMAIITLESHKNKCLVIGEDLGNPPQGFSETINKHLIFSNKVMCIDKSGKDSFTDPQKYPYFSLCQTSTHDHATGLGFWNAEDIKINKICNNIKGKDYKNKLTLREAEKKSLIKMIIKNKSFFENEKEILNGKNISYSLSLLSAKSKSAIYLVRIEDLYSQIEMQNVPGTNNEYLNWQIKIKEKTDKIKDNKTITKFIKILNKIRN